jgi:hypothetical protein
VQVPATKLYKRRKKEEGRRKREEGRGKTILYGYR